MARNEFEMPDEPIGPLLLKNLLRLGHASIVAHSKSIADEVAKRTGKKLSRQRVAALMNAVKVEPETIAMLAKGLGVKPSELLRTDNE